MTGNPIKALAFGAGVFCTVIAFGYDSITRIDGDYRSNLIATLAFTLMAAAAFVVPFRGGSLRWKIAVAVAVAPLGFVVLDFCERASSVFGTR